MCTATFQATFLHPNVESQVNMPIPKTQPPHKDDINSKLSELTTDLSWVKKSGWTILVFYAVVFAGLIKWYLPKELDQLRETVKGDTSGTIHQLDSRISTIEVQLNTLIGFQKEALLKSIASQSPKFFAASLPVLQKVIEHPPSEQFKPDAPTLLDIAASLRDASENIPDYWPTVLQFLQFASAGMSPDVPPPGKPTSSASGNKGFPVSLHLYHEVVLLMEEI